MSGPHTAMPPRATTLRRAKIVCTIGPASDSPEMLNQLCAAGMDVARLNFSHGTHEEHLKRIREIRAAAERNRRTIAILQDLCGPKIRAGRFPTGFMEAATGAEIDLLEGDVERVPGTLPIGYQGLAEDVQVDDHILIDDGRVAFRVVSKSVREGLPCVRCVVEQGGRIQSRAGVFLPSRNLRIDALTEKDKVDLAFGLEHGVDYVALSFVRHPRDVEQLRELCESMGRPTPIVSKIETPSAAIDHLDAIVRASAAVMVARGDLAVEVSPEQVPVLQKRILAVARRHRTPVIVATEMLHSMVKSTRPTRAEASDVATAVYDGADAVMLSAESASGDHPRIAVEMMAKIIQVAENSPYYDPPVDVLEVGKTTVAESVARNACDVAHQVRARLVLSFTHSGDSARYVSKGRPTVPIVAFSPLDSTQRQLALVWGVLPQSIDVMGSEEELIQAACRKVLERGLATIGDRIVLVYGAPLNVRGTTNVVRVHELR